ncbi:MAG: amidohydrolase family protein, partial [Bacteroidia bacterium]|nr:amidohydrolase family protein [Bacteroidia bacterium]
MNYRNTLSFFVLLFLSIISCTDQPDHEIDLLLSNGKVWTGDANTPWASWIAIQDDKIVALGSENDRLPLANKVIDLQGKLTVPGFNDSHVHFASAGALLLGINLLDVNDEVGLKREIKGATERLPKRSWITRGDWGAYEAWGLGSDGSSTKTTIFTPHRSMIDDLTPDHPVLINRYDRTEGLANALALEILDIESETGLLTGEVFRNALEQIPEKSIERKTAEAMRALEECRKFGVTTVQDMSPLDRENIYQSIHDNGDLTCRINFSPSRLSEYENMAAKGWAIKNGPEGPQPAGDDWISFGTLKTHIDGIMG